MNFGHIQFAQQLVAESAADPAIASEPQHFLALGLNTRKGAVSLMRTALSPMQFCL